MEQNNFMNSFIKTFIQSRMGIEDALGLELFCFLVYKRFTEYRETRFKSPTQKLTIRQYIVYQQPIHPPHLEGMILTSPFLLASSGSQDLDSPFFPKSDSFISNI